MQVNFQKVTPEEFASMVKDPYTFYRIKSSSFTPSSWSTATDAEIVEALQKHYAGEINIYDYWHVGDERQVNLKAMEKGDMDETHEAQTVTLVLMNEGGKTLSTPIGSSTECAFIVGQKNTLSEMAKIHSTRTNVGGWQESPRRTWCNTIYRDAFPDTLKPIFKQFENQSCYGGGSVTIVTTDDYFAFPAEKEVANTTTKSGSGEGQQFEYYQTASNRIKTLGENGSATYWPLRSPSKNDSTQFVYVQPDGIINAGYADSLYGLAPFGCI